MASSTVSQFDTVKSASMKPQKLRQHAWQNAFTLACSRRRTIVLCAGLCRMRTGPFVPSRLSQLSAVPRRLSLLIITASIA